MISKDIVGQERFSWARVQFLWQMFGIAWTEHAPSWCSAGYGSSLRSPGSFIHVCGTLAGLTGRMGLVKPLCLPVSLRQLRLISNVGTTGLWSVRALWASASRSWGKGFRASHDRALEVRKLTPTIFSWSGRSKRPAQIQEKKLRLQPFRGIANHFRHP